MTAWKSQTIFITGATSGIGAACARRFSALGCKVVIAGRRRERLEALQTELGNGAMGLELDVRERGKVAEAIQGLPSNFSEISILVNSAGLALGLEPANEAVLDDWDQMIDTNCKGLAYCTRALLPGMIARGRGHVVNIGSVAGTYPYPGGNVYGATKAFVHQFSLNLRAELLGHPIRVTDIEPGLTETEFSAVRFHGDRARAQKVYEGVKPLSGQDIAEAVVWAASLPEHMNINVIELMPVAQAFGPFAIKRKS